MDWNLFWTAFGAIGGTLGAVATTAAVIVALWQTKYANKKRLKVEFSDNIIVVPSQGDLSAYPLDGHADGCVFHQSFHSIFWEGGSSVSFSRLQSDFPYTIFTPFRRGVVWNCMKLYSGHLCRKYAEIKNYRYLWSTIEI